jgi:hypothetical protein
MLEGECDEVLDALNRDSDRVTRESLADDNLDAAQFIGGTPIVLS